MSDQSDGEIGRPLMSPESVDAAARSAHAVVTCPNLQPDDPGHPLTESGFWGAFTRSLEGRWEQFKKEHEEATNTFDNDNADGQTKLVTDGGRVQDGEVVNRSGETAAIFTSHGVLDAATTILAARAVGPSAEANPIVRELLAMGELPAAVAMLAAVGLCCGAWPVAADALEAPEWIGLGVATVGAAVAAVNLVVVFA